MRTIALSAAIALGGSFGAPAQTDYEQLMLIMDDPQMDEGLKYELFDFVQNLKILKELRRENEATQQ